MPDSPSENDKASYYSDHQSSPLLGNWWLMVSLIVIGILLVVMADLIGVSVVRRPGGWSPDDVRRVALDVRCVGAMSFTAGLVERVLIQISKLKT